MKKSSRKNDTPSSVQREQDVILWDGWGRLFYTKPSEGSNLSGVNNNEVDSLVSDLFQEPAGLPGEHNESVS